MRRRVAKKRCSDAARASVAGVTGEGGASAFRAEHAEGGVQGGGGAEAAQRRQDEARYLTAGGRPGQRSSLPRRVPRRAWAPAALTRTWSRGHHPRTWSSFQSGRSVCSRAPRGALPPPRRSHPGHEPTLGNIGSEGATHFVAGVERRSCTLPGCRAVGGSMGALPPSGSHPGSRVRPRL